MYECNGNHQAHLDDDNYTVLCNHGLHSLLTFLFLPSFPSSSEIHFTLAMVFTELVTYLSNEFSKKQTKI